MRFLLALLFCMIPAAVQAQFISLTLDAKATDTILEKELGRRTRLTSVFAVENVRIDHITASAVVSHFDLVFDGALDVPMPFLGTRTLNLRSTLPLEARCVPSFDGKIIFIPVKDLVISYRNTVHMKLGNHAMAILVAFKRWVFSDSGKSMLEKNLTVDLEAHLRKFFGNMEFTGKLQLARDRITLQLSRKTTGTR